MDFHFHGQRIRESTEMPSITRAREVQNKRKQGLRDGSAGIRKPEAPRLVSAAAEEFCERKAQAWSPSMRVSARNSLNHLLPVFGKRLLSDVDASGIAKYQRARLAEGASNRTVNIEVGLLRSIMRRHGLWARVGVDVSMLRERDDAGRALTAEEESILLAECAASRSRILHPLVLTLLETGARLNTVRTLQWGNVDFAGGSLKIGKDKTAAGTGRTIPLSHRGIETLRFWSQGFPDRTAENSVFPAEKYATSGEQDGFGFTPNVIVVESDPSKPIGSVKQAWECAKERTRHHCPQCASGRLTEAAKPATGYECGACHWKTADLPPGLTSIRLHDLRHTAVSRMIAARVPLPMIGKIVGWSPGTLAKMAARYGHFSIEEMRSAVETISRPPEVPAGYPKKSPMSPDSAEGIIQ
jgi:integrase